MAINPDQPLRAFVYDPPRHPYLNVLHFDEDILVVGKPSGLLSVPGKAAEHADCLELRARSCFPSATIVHRLDNATSGVMVLALNKSAHRHLGKQFERRLLQKTYIARVWGHIGEDRGHIDLPLICDWPNRPKQHVNFERGKPAQTSWQVIERERAAKVTRLRLTPRTGRSHQLRVHMQSIGHPILGDRFYAHDEALAAAERLQLHAESLTFRHPCGGALRTFRDPCPF